MDRAAEEVRGAWEGRQADEKGGGEEMKGWVEDRREEEREDGGERRCFPSCLCFIRVFQI